ncbi:MAG: extracellular solute-binding protein [Spirochaetales bacterium]|nr:extracellular solute-binding protein [Spirochaetales bacterium]
MKKIMVVLLILILSSAFVFAGGDSEEKSGEITLKWWHHMPLDGAQGKLFAEYAKEFETANPGVTIVIESIPHAEYIKKIPTAIASGQAPDIYGLSYRNLYSYADNGAMAPLDEAALKALGLSSYSDLEAQWAPGALDSYKIGNTYYGLPFQFNIYAYIINTKHFKEAGLDPEKDYPKTWDEVYEVAAKLVQKNGDRITRQAMSFPFEHSAAWYMLELEPIIRELGGSILNDSQTECVVNSPEGIKAMEEIQKRFDLGVADSNIAASLDYYNEGFPTGKFSITVGGQWGPGRWYKNFEDVTDGTDFMPIAYPSYPGKDPAISTTSWAWVVSSTSKKKDMAWKLADYITSMASRNIIETGDTIPRAGWSETEGAKTIPYADFWEDMIQYSQPLANFEKYSEVSEPLKRAMQEILLSGADIKKTLDSVKKEIDLAISE